MKVNFSFLSHERFLLLFLYSALALALLASVSSGTGFHTILDYVNHVGAIVQANSAHAEGQFPLRVMPDELSGWRYPYYQFYSPSVYMFASWIYRWITPSNPLTAYQLTLWFSLVLGGIYMNRLAYWFVKSRPAALLASLVYLASPYYLVVVNHLAAFSEAMALGILPATLYYTFQRYTHPAENRTLLQTALAWYLLATTHSITFMYTSLFVALLLLLITFKNYRYWLNLIDVGIAYAFGCVLAMWHVAPIMMLAKYLKVNSLVNSDRLNYHRLTLANLLTPAQNILNIPNPDYGIIDSIFQVHPNIGLPMLLAMGICFYVYVKKIKLENKRAEYWLPSLFLTFMLSIFVAWSPINFWRWLPHFLMMGQYSWRIMSQSIWTGSLLFALAVCWIFKNKLDERHVLLGIFLILVTANIWLPVPERSFMTVDPATINKNPQLVSNNDIYEIDAKKNMQLVNAVNDVSLDFVNQDRLKLNFPYSIRQSLVAIAVRPYVFVDGTIVADDAVLNRRIAIVLNGGVVATHVMKAGPFHWEIPVNAKKNLPKNNASLSLEFKSEDLKNNKVYLPAKQMMLGGFLKTNEVLDVDQMKPHCQQQKDTTVCTLTASSVAKLIELPLFYYPDLWHVTINGRPAAYSSVLTQNRLAVAVMSLPGVVNTIKIQFTGLQWANGLSTLGWELWFLFLLFLVLRAVTDKFQQSTKK